MQVELFQSVDTDQSADVSEKEYDAWVDKQKEEQNKEYEKIANAAREEYMGDQMKEVRFEPLVGRFLSGFGPDF